MMGNEQKILLLIIVETFVSGVVANFESALTVKKLYSVLHTTDIAFFFSCYAAHSLHAEATIQLWWTLHEQIVGDYDLLLNNIVRILMLLDYPYSLGMVSSYGYIRWTAIINTFKWQQQRWTAIRNAIKCFEMKLEFISAPVIDCDQ